MLNLGGQTQNVICERTCRGSRLQAGSWINISRSLICIYVSPTFYFLGRKKKEKKKEIRFGRLRPRSALKLHFPGLFLTVMILQWVVLWKMRIFEWVLSYDCKNACLWHPFDPFLLPLSPTFISSLYIQSFREQNVKPEAEKTRFYTGLYQSWVVMYVHVDLYRIARKRNPKKHRANCFRSFIWLGFAFGCPCSIISESQVISLFADQLAPKEPSFGKQYKKYLNKNTTKRMR